METIETLKTFFLVWVFAAGVSAAASSSFQDEKNLYFYYTPYPNAGSPPATVSYQNPPPAQGNDPPAVTYQNPPPAPSVTYQNPPPAQANDPPAVSYPPPAQANNPPAVSYQYPPPAQPNNPPSGSSITPVRHTPSHGHHHHHHHEQQPPTTNCGIPPPAPVGYHNPTPPPSSDDQHVPPSTGTGGAPSGTPVTPTQPPVVTPPPTPTGYHNPTPPPSTGDQHVPPSTGTKPPVVTPPSPTGDHNSSPPKSGCTCGSSTPAGPVVGPSPAEQPPTGYHYYPPPSTAPSTDPSTTPHITPPSSTTKPTPRPPKTPSTTPHVTVPSPPSFPNIPFLGGTCDFWRTHPHLLSDLFGLWRTSIGRAMGLGGIPGLGTTMNFQEALSSTRTDGIGALYREGTTALLNSMVNKNFPFTTSHVRDSFVAALASNKVAAAQAEVFKLANEGQLKPRI